MPVRTRDAERRLERKPLPSPPAGGKGKEREKKARTALQDRMLPGQWSEDSAARSQYRVLAWRVAPQSGWLGPRKGGGGGVDDRKDELRR